MTANMGWREAIVKVLESTGTAMHYSDITQQIIDSGYRTKVGATPAATVAAVLSTSLKQDGESSPFVRAASGIYSLRTAATNPSPTPGPTENSPGPLETSEQMGLINAFGMFWARSSVFWSNGKPRLLGVQQSGSTPVDFSSQAGVYLLYDGTRVIYVGRVTEPRLGARLWEHTRDRLSSRWDRFSWFGVRDVDSDGNLGSIPTAGIAVKSLIVTLEALLIEGLEPPQNRRQGDGFSALEFIQERDKKIEIQHQKELLAKMTANIGLG